MIQHISMAIYNGERRMFKLTIDEKLHLELTAMHHADRLFELVKKNSELFSRWLVWVESTKTVHDTRTFIQSAMNNYSNHQEVNCVIVYDEVVVGDIALLGMGRKHNGTKQGELGYWLDSDYHGKGIMHRCAKKMIEIGFNYYDLDKILLRCAVANNRSCNVAQKLGFTLEGHIRDDILINGKMLDANLYGLLREEFKIMRSF